MDDLDATVPEVLATGKFTAARLVRVKKAHENAHKDTD
jgi:hypothetical protein